MDWFIYWSQRADDALRIAERYPASSYAHERWTAQAIAYVELALNTRDALYDTDANDTLIDDVDSHSGVADASMLS